MDIMYLQVEIYGTIMQLEEESDGCLKDYILRISFGT